MGDVWRARDLTLRRDVALKVVAGELARTGDSIARFEREAQLLASLNHPHIAAIYGVEQSTAGVALVLELVEGPTLADLIDAVGSRFPRRSASDGRSRRPWKPRTTAASSIGI